jgi:hypothetical protein
MSYLNATHAGKGYEQSGGGYFYVVDVALATKLLVWGTANLPAGSGGAWTVGTFTAAQSVTNALPGNASTLFSQGRVVRDMGKSLVSAGRTFRKIKGMIPNASGTAGVNAYSVFNTDGGVGAGVVNGIDQGYLTFYVETTRDGDVQVGSATGTLGGSTSGPAGLVRFM